PCFTPLPFTDSRPTLRPPALPLYLLLSQYPPSTPLLHPFTFYCLKAHPSSPCFTPLPFTVSIPTLHPPASPVY
ncbi:predicted protein, partial [Nematostella vectensis]